MIRNLRNNSTFTLWLHDAKSEGSLKRRLKWPKPQYVKSTFSIMCSLFFKRGGLLNNESWSYKGDNIEVVNDFNYLGTVFNYTGTFALNQETLVGKGLKALDFYCIIQKSIVLNLRLCVNYLTHLSDLYLAFHERYGVSVRVKKSKEFT